jgi:hypothetical protein
VFSKNIVALLRQAAEWLAPVADADRLGYPPREAAQ